MGEKITLKVGLYFSNKLFFIDSTQVMKPNIGMGDLKWVLMFC